MRDRDHMRIGPTLVLAAITLPGLVTADPMVTQSYNLYGVPGLVEMPTAESAPDAEFSANFSQAGEQSRTTLTFQFAPRISGSFRYAQIPGFNDDGSDRFDRSFDLRFQFVDESEWIPAVAVGFQDFIGTGLYSAEYLVATKTFWDDFRVTAGLGWGRLGSRNPIAEFGERPTEYEETGGTVNYDRWFTGPMAIFGGVAWKATDKLTLKAEYSSDSYEEETRRGLTDYDTPLNFGAEYRFGPGASVSAAYLYGSEVGLQVNFTLNPKSPVLGPGNEEAPRPVRPRPSRSADPSAWATDWISDEKTVASEQAAITRNLARDGIEVETIQLTANRVEIRVENRRYQSETQAIGRTARALSRAMPASVETFVIVPVNDGVPNSKITFNRSDIERLENAASQEILDAATYSDAAGGLPDGTLVNEEAYPGYSWFLTPYLALSTFDPDEPLRGDFGLRLGGEAQFAPGIVVAGSIRQRLVGTLDQIDRESNSVLPRVRTDFPLYLKNSTALQKLWAGYFARPGRDIYSRISAGYFETMYAGVSGEILWKPVDSKLGLGAELNYVRQRDFDGLFGLNDYEVVTGHASAYYEFLDGYHAQVDVGRYLAGDVGATLSLDREFGNGWRFGAFATFTDVEYDEFGEGSFDKGIRMTIPLGWASGRPTRQDYNVAIRPLTRDGGARVNIDGRLYDRVRYSHQPRIEQSGGRFWR